MRNPEIERYLSSLRERLSGRLPSEQISDVIAETESHLTDLVEDFQGDANAAIARFGSPRKMARRLLRKLEVLPTEREAARWPLILAGIAFLGSFVAGIVLSRPHPYYGSFFLNGYFYQSMVLLSIAFIYACFRGRRMVFKSLALFCVAIFAANLLINSVVSFSIPGRSGYFVSALKVDADAYVAGSSQRLSALDQQLGLLERGKVYFQGAKKEPGEFANPGSGYMNPEQAWGVERPSIPILIPRTPLFVQTSVEYPEKPLTWDEAVAVWRHADTFIGQARRQRQLEANIGATVEAGLKESPLVYIQRFGLGNLMLCLSSYLLLIYMNFVGWALSQLYRRIVWPRRRLRA